MPNELLVAVLSGLGGMFGWGAADFFAKKTIDRIGAIASLVWAHLFGTLALIGLTLIQFFIFGKLIDIPSSPDIWLGLIFFGTLQMIVYWLVYEGFGKGQLAVLNPVFASFSGLVALFSVIVLGEKLSGQLIYSLAAIFLGILLINIDINGLRSRRLNVVPGLKEVAIATILAAGWTLGWDGFVGGADSLSFTLFMYTFMTIAAIVLANFIKSSHTKSVKKDLWKFLVLIGLSEVVAYLAISIGYSATSFTSVVALISGAFSVPTVILARLFLKEKVTGIQTLGTVVIILGIILLSVR